jgi:hypothetical protein
MSYSRQVSADAPSMEQVAEQVSAATGVSSQSLLGNAFLSSIVGTIGSVTGAGETCEASAEDSWLENVVESLFGRFGIGNDPASCEAAGGTTSTVTPPVDISQYTWLVGVYVASGALDQASAEALLTQASAEQLAATLSVADSTAVAPASPAVPAADLGTDDNNRAMPLDWSAPVAAGHIRPEASETAASGSALGDVFQAHLTDLMAESFGAGVTLDQVRGAIQLADALGRADVSAALQAGLFRANQYAAVATLNVEDSSRYAASGETTYCNIYAYDLVTALGAYIPRTWWYNNAISRIQAGETPISVAEHESRIASGQSVAGTIHPVYGETVRELDANSLNTWMQEWGASFGWSRAASADAAQQAANAGNIVVILADGLGVPGHVSVVLSEGYGSTADRDAGGEVYAPLQSQAGAINANHDTLSQGEGSAQWWEDSLHADGGFWISSGTATSPIVTPESLGR